MSAHIPLKYDDRTVLGLIRFFASESSDGCLEVMCGPYRGMIFFKDQRLVHAEYQGKKGMPALYDLLPWEDVVYKWYVGINPDMTSFSFTLPELEAYDTAGENTPPLNVPKPPPGLTNNNFPEGPGDGELFYQELESNILEQHVVSLEWNDAPGGPQTFRFEGKVQSGCVIGSADDCEFIIREPSIEPLHCSLMIHDDYVEIWDLGTAEKTQVNGTVVEQAVLTSGDILLLGDVELRFTLRIRRKLGGARNSSEQTIPSPTIKPGKIIPKTAISYASLGSPPAPKPGVVKALRRLLFRTTNRIQKPKK